MNVTWDPALIFIDVRICVASQIGTYNAAVLAARHKVAFIVVAPVSTVDLDIPDGTQ